MSRRASSFVLADLLCRNFRLATVEEVRFRHRGTHEPFKSVSDFIVAYVYIQIANQEVHGISLNHGHMDKFQVAFWAVQYRRCSVVHLKILTRSD